jgi:uncharacterized protein
MNELTPPSLTLLNTALLFSTAVLAGGLNAVAGGGSFITFPTLIFTGVPPIAANATNNTAMWVAALASIGAYRQDLQVERRLLVILSVTSLIGGTIGAIALLYTSSEIFKQLIPYLLLLATLVFIFGERLKIWSQSLTGESSTDRPSLVKLVFLQLVISIYGGFFGAGIGILMLATMTFSGIKNIHAMNALKAVLGSCINGIAIVPFIFAGAIVWQQAAIMSIGGSLGSYVAARLARKIRSHIVRRFVAIVAISMTIYFFVRR